MQKSTVKTCPYCIEQINIKAIKCRFCGEMYDGSVPPSIKALANALGFVIEDPKDPEEQTSLEDWEVLTVPKSNPSKS